MTNENPKTEAIKSRRPIGVVFSEFVRRIFCHHNWTLHSRDRYAVTRADDSKEGEVTLTLMKCSKCGKDWLIPMDRTHSPNVELKHGEETKQ